jgi:hypothetical protein
MSLEKGTEMKFAIETNNGWVSLQPDGSIQYRPKETTPGPYEIFNLVSLDPPISICKFVPSTPSTPTGFDPAVRQPWPRPMPPDIDTTVENEVIDRVDWNLQNLNSSDDRSYWVDVIQGRKEHLAVPGWTADGYWRTEKMAHAEGNGKGYVWPPR